MKYFKRLVFAALLAVGAIFLVACGSTTSDGCRRILQSPEAFADVFSNGASCGHDGVQLCL